MGDGRPDRDKRTGAKAGDIEFRTSDDPVRLTVFLFPGAQVRVLQNGEEIYSTVGGPEIPASGALTVREFVEKIFGG